MRRTGNPAKLKSGQPLMQTAEPFVMQYTVVIVQDGDVARLECATWEEAVQVHQSFINYGRCQSVTIEHLEDTI